MGKIKMNHYMRIWDNQNRVWIYEHRKAMEQKLGRKLFPTEQVHHLDGNILNNDPSNLKIVTVTEHYNLHRPYKFRRLFKNEKVFKIRKLRKEGYRLGTLALMFGAHESTISRICNRKRYA